MNKHRKPQKISGILETLINKINHESRSNLEFLQKIWIEAVGERIDMHSRPVQFKGNKLLVHVENSAWMNELTYLKDQIKIQCQKAFSKKDLALEAVIFRIGDTKKSTEKSGNVPPSGQ